MKRMLNILVFVLGISSNACYGMEKRDLSQFEEQNDDKGWEAVSGAEKISTQKPKPKANNDKLSLYGKLNQKVRALTEQKKQKGMRTIFIKIKPELMEVELTKLYDGSDEIRVVFADTLDFASLGLKIKNREFSPGLGCYRLTFDESMQLEQLFRLQNYPEIAGIAPGKGVDWELLRQERERMCNAKINKLRKK